MKNCKKCGGTMKAGGAVKKLTKAQKGISVEEKNPDKLVKEKGGKDPAIGSAAYRKLFNSKQAMDSANYYRNKGIALSKIPTSSKDFDKVIKNNSDLQRQYDKGKPGYDDMGNKKDAQGRPSSSKWYGYDPKAKKYIMGPNKGKTQAEVMKSSGTKKMAEGGSTGLVGMPRYSNNPRSEQGRILKKGGSIKKMQKGGQTLADMEKETRRDIFGSKSGRIGIGTSVAGMLGVAAKAITDKVKAKKEAKKAEEEKKKKTTATPKAKFGASVNVQRGYPGKIRSAKAQGYTAIGKREPGRAIKTK